jgi:exodeoxyribonuclease VII large subunit
MAVPPRAELLADVAQKHARLLGAAARAASERRLRLNTAAARLPDLPGLLGNARVKCDDRAQRLAMALPNLLAARRGALIAVERHIPDPSVLIAARAGTLRELALRHRNGLLPFLHRRRNEAAALLGRLNVALPAARMRECALRLEGLAARLEGASYASVLARGFALVRDNAGRPVTRAHSIRPHAKLVLVFADGEIRVQTDGTTATLQASLPL